MFTFVLLEYLNIFNYFGNCGLEMDITIGSWFYCLNNQ